MLASLWITLRQCPALQSFEQTTGAISRFLGPPPNLLLSEACERGSIATLDCIWTASCTTVEGRTPRWSLTNYLRSDPHYYRWQFAKSLHAAAERGDLVIVEWLFSHFSGCEAPADVVEIAASEGNLRVLRFLWEHRSRAQKVAAQDERLSRGDAGGASDCTVHFDETYDGTHWGDMVIEKAVENGQLAECLDDGMQIDHDDRVPAIKRALRLGDVELAERLVPSGESILDYAAICPRPEVIEKLLSEGFLQWNEPRAALAFRSLAKGGSCELLQRIFQLHSPVQEDHSRWKRTWCEALRAACSGGNMSALKWLMEHSLGSDVCDQGKLKTLNREFFVLLCEAATKGHIEVMEFLYEKNMAVMSVFVINDAIRQGQVSSIKWFVDHDMIGDQKAFISAFETAARYGHVDILQQFQTMNKPGGYAAADTLYLAAQAGHVGVLEWLQANYPTLATGALNAMDAAVCEGHLDAVKWLHANRTEGCTSNALKWAAENGHFEVVKWLYANRPESRIPSATLAAFRSEHLRIADWLRSKFPDYELGQHSGDTRLFCAYSFHGKPLEALLFLRAIYPSTFTEMFVNRTREECTSEHRENFFTTTLVLRWLDDNYHSTPATEVS